MLVEYKKLKYGYSEDGWNEVYKCEYGDFNKLRLKLLLEDEAIYDVTKDIFKLILDCKVNNSKVELLDIGCGVGHQLCLISPFCDAATGFDISQEVVDDNNMLNINADFVKGDALNHPKFANKFNIILMAGVLYAVDEKRETHKRILQEAYRSLSDNGKFIFYHRAYLNILLYLDKKMCSFLGQKNREVEYSMCYFDDKYLLKIMDEVGFKVVEVKKYDFSYAMVQTFFKYIFTKKKYWDYDNYKEYTSGYNKEYNSYNKLNVLGKLISIVSKYTINSLTARTSMFVLQKRHL